MAESIERCMDSGFVLVTQKWVSNINRLYTDFVSVIQKKSKWCSVFIKNDDNLRDSGFKAIFQKWETDYL